ncbi:ataxin-1 [Trichomycterus rosablanca]|uniref:ataxin-1 n=1 Tax=Trichomycterus rosablanca TaxID=2290929 RepID=UPI002F355BAF
MNPSLPPKKRESRQGSSGQRPLEEDFKFPAPLQTRRQHLPEGREAELRSDKDLLPPPPPPPPLPPLPLALPWHLPYYSSLHSAYLTGHVRDRRGSGSPSWRDGSSGRRPEGLEPSIAQNSSWLRRDINPLSVHPSIPIPTYKSNYGVNSRDMWPCMGHDRRDYTSSLFSPSSSSSSHLFPQPSIYHHNIPSDSRLRYSCRRPNGLDGQASRLEPGATTDAANDPLQRMGATERMNNQDDPARHGAARGSLSRDGRNAHSFSQNTDRDSRLGIPKPQTYTSESRRGKPHAPGSASQSGAQIYYALGSLYPSTHHNPQAYPHLKPSGPPPSPLRNSQHPHAQPNSHGVDQERDFSLESYRPSVSVLSGPDPPPSAVLPHFAKGSLIELAGGRLKRVEELLTEDFLHSADTSPEFHLSTCTILLISPGPSDGFNHLQVLLTDRNTQELLTVLEEYPFFVRDRGWSSCSPRRSAQLYGLQCRQLSTGDVCLALTPTPTLLFPPTTSPTSTPTSVTPVPSSTSSATSTRTSSTPTPTNLRPLSCTRISTGSDRTDRRLAPPAPSDSRRENQDHPRPRKRRWSAPELQERNTDLPQGCKRVKQQ